MLEIFNQYSQMDVVVLLSLTSVISFLITSILCAWDIVLERYGFYMPEFYRYIVYTVSTLCALSSFSLIGYFSYIKFLS